MKQHRIWILLIGLHSMTIVSFGQVRPAPPEVANAFTKMFPDARNIMWRDKLTNFCGYFADKGEKCEAKFTPDGKWISTEESILWDSLPPLVMDSLKSCKYADWQRASAYILRSAVGTTQYHIVVMKNDLGRKILFFNQNGQLMSEH